MRIYKIDSSTRYEGKPCKNCRNTTRYVSNGVCIVCNRKYMSKLMTKRRSTPEGKVKNSEARRKSIYGLTAEEFKLMEEKQNGVCYCCGGESKNRKLNIDHNHTTGKVRKLLCNRCNMVIGFLEKTPELVNIWIKYLNDHNE